MNRLVVANWKMNLDLAQSMALGQGCLQVAEKYHQLTVIICPSALWLVPLREAMVWLPPNFAFGSQSVSSYPEGAYTGDLAATQFKGLVQYALVGHSERRRYHHESGPALAAMVQLLLGQRITPIICFGEQSMAQQHKFSSQITVDLEHDLSGLSVAEIEQCFFAYEPLWAIGTGTPATSEYIEQVLTFIQTWAHTHYNQSLRILYGGSVTEDEATSLGKLSGLSGLLVGGASLHVKSLEAICARFCAV